LKSFFAGQGKGAGKGCAGVSSPRMQQEAFAHWQLAAHWLHAVCPGFLADSKVQTEATGWSICPDTMHKLNRMATSRFIYDIRR
jgi:hypothetical protein